MIRLSKNKERKINYLMKKEKRKWKIKHIYIYAFQSKIIRENNYIDCFSVLIVWRFLWVYALQCFKTSPTILLIVIMILKSGTLLRHCNFFNNLYYVLQNLTLDLNF